jgi:hypothetical protein
VNQTVLDNPSNKTCSRCGETASSMFCPKGGNSLVRQKDKKTGWFRNVTGLIGFGLIAAVGYLTFVGIPTFKILSSDVDLSVEVSPVRGQRYGFVSITNLSTDPVQIREVRINRRTDDQCSDRSGHKLATGERALIGTGPSVAGLCGGSIVRVTVITDKGDADYTIDW